MFDIPFLDIAPLQSAHGTVALPGSKSISNRVLLLAALCEGQRTTIHDVLESDDTDAMLAALQRLGCTIEHEEGSRIWHVEGLSRSALPELAQLHLGNAGTAMRPLTAALALLATGAQTFELTGVARMQERPIGDLVDALRQVGARIDYLANPGYPPLRIQAPDCAQAARQRCVSVRGNVSSQFLTALLMALPLLAAERDYVVEVEGELISKPYIHITLSLLARFGIHIINEGWQRFVIPAGSSYRSPGQIHVEADASSASYFIALGGIASDASQGHSITIEGVGSDSIQGDIRFLDAAQQMGVQVESGANWVRVQRGLWPLKAIDLDCNHIPDAAMTLAVMALYADGQTTLRNIGSWRVKETDRLDAMQAELRKLGAQVATGEDWIRITPPAAQQWKPASIATYDDHRMAMCFSLAAFNPAALPVRIQDPRCVGKTFPDYFESLFALVKARPDTIPVICIDGPSASGKGTLAAAVGQQLGFATLDSGALYRIAGWAARQRGIEITAANAQALAQLARTMPVQFLQDKIYFEGQDITLAIRSNEGSRNASLISAIGPVREALLDFQRQQAKLPGLVADGRDMGTVVFPQARLKVFLTASAEKRAQRRHKQLLDQGFPANIDTLLEELEQRDARDRERSVAPLRPAADAFMLDNSDMSVAQAADQIMQWWAARQAF